MVTAESPYPPTSGVPLRNWQNINALARLGRVDLLSLGVQAAPAHIPLVDAWEHVVLERGDAQSQTGYPILTEPQAEQALPAIRRLVAERQPDLVLFENIAIPNMTGLSGNQHLVFDSHNVFAALMRELGRPVDGVRALESHFMAACDQVWLCSDADASLVRAEYGARVRTAVIPNAIDMEFYTPVANGVRPRARTSVSTLAFIGAYWYEPNRQGALWLLRHVLPLLREREPATRLVFVGPGATDEMCLAAHDDSAVVVTGPVADVRPFLAAAGAVAIPLFAGGGTRFKALEALAAKRPVVTTSKGVEGLDVSDGVDVMVRDDPNGFAEAVLAIWRDARLASRLTENGYALVERLYAWPVAQARVQSALAQLRVGT